MRGRKVSRGNRLNQVKPTFRVIPISQMELNYLNAFESYLGEVLGGTPKPSG
jgi:hypothetical protein